MNEPTTVYTCSRCDWRGTNPCWTEENLEACVDERTGLFHETIVHRPVCRLCYAPSKRADPKTVTVSA